MTAAIIVPVILTVLGWLWLFSRQGGYDKRRLEDLEALELKTDKLAEHLNRTELTLSTHIEHQIGHEKLDDERFGNLEKIAKETRDLAKEVLRCVSVGGGR